MEEGRGGSAPSPAREKDLKDRIPTPENPRWEKERIGGRRDREGIIAMLEYLTLGEFVVAVLMGLAALCAFIWGATSGAFRNVEAIKYQVLRLEVDDDRRGT